MSHSQNFGGSAPNRYKAVVGKQASVGGSSGYTPYSVLIGDYGETYKKPNNSSTSLFSSNQGTPATLTRNPANSSNPTSYTYTTAEGVAYGFSTSVKTVGTLTAEAHVTSVTYPTGEVQTYHYLTVPKCTTTACGSTTPITRLQAITNNFGYQIKLLYAANTTPVPVVAYSWFELVGAKGVNMAVDYCAPTATDCVATTQAWPSVSYNYENSYVAVRDSTNTQIYAYRNDILEFHLRLGSSQSDNISYSFTPGNPYAVSSVTRGGQQWSYTYASAAGNSTTTVTDPAGRLTTYVFDEATGSIKSVTNTANEVTTYLNDPLGRKTTVTVPSGAQIQYTYDARGNTTEVRRKAWSSGLQDLVWTFNYDVTCSNLKKCNKPNWTRDPANNQTTYAYHASSGEVQAVTLPAVNGISPVITNTYTQYYAYFKNASGAIVQAATPAWFLTRSSECRTTVGCSATSAEQMRTDITYGANGVANNRLPLTTTARSGSSNSLVATTSMTYDSLGNLMSTDGPMAGVVDRVTFRYDSQRRVIGTIGPDPDDGGPRMNLGLRTMYSSSGDVVSREVGTLSGQSEASWGGFVPLQATTFDYDAEGREVKRTRFAGGAARAVAQRSFDLAGRVECTVDRMDSTSFGSLPGACALSGLGQFGPDRISKYSYDSADRLTQVVSGYGVDPLATLTQTYNPSGLLHTQVDANGQVTTYEYDGHARVTRMYFPDPNAAGISSATDYEEYGYDQNSNVVSTRRRSGAVIVTPRDNWGRVQVRDLPGGTAEDVYFNYDNQGRLLWARYGSASGAGIDLTYDSLGRLATRTSFGRGLSYEYDLAGRRIRVTHPDAFFATYEYTNLGELRTVRENGAAAIATFDYDELGFRTSHARPNSTATTYLPDALKRLEQFTQDISGTAFDLSASFDYNPANQIVAKEHNNEAAFTWVPSSPTSTHNADYDGQNKLKAFNGGQVNSDANGNLVSGIGPLSYNYDHVGQLRSASGGATPITIDYDTLGMLRRVASGSSTTEFVYDGDDLILEYVGGAIARRYVHGVGSDEPLVWYEGSTMGNPTYLYADERGSIIAGANASGVGTSTAKYSAFGDSGALVSPFGYTGQRYLPELDLYYYKARMYSPQAGRFLQPDPIGYGDGMNTYAYVGGDPINRIDPWGLTGDELLEEMTEVQVTGARIVRGSRNACQTRQYCVAVSDGDMRHLQNDAVSGSGGGDVGAGGSPQSQQPTQCFKPQEPRTSGQIISDVIVGFGDAFLIPIIVRNIFDIEGDIDYGGPAYTGGMITGTLWGSATIALRGGAALGGTKVGHALNHNPTVRLGPGRMPAAGGLPSGTGVPRISFGSRPGGLHGDLRSRIPHLPPVGGLVGGGDGC